MRSNREHPDIRDELAVGEWIHDQLMPDFGLETEAWAIERVRRVTDRLNVARSPNRALAAEILWIDVMTAFAVPGRYVYVGRELLQRCATDDPVAFTLAHEMAHHDLGHMDLFQGSRRTLRLLPGGPATGLLLRAMDRLILGPDQESAADKRAIELCLNAGFDGSKCLELFGILEAYALDHRDLDIVYGIEDNPSDSHIHLFVQHVREWAWEHVRGYHCLRDRKEAIHRILTEKAAHAIDS